MTDDQARDSIKAVEQMWNCEIVNIPTWVEALVPFDSVTVAGTILRLFESSGDRPDLDTLVAAVQAMQQAKQAGPEDAEETDKEHGHFVYEIAPWVKAWSVARYRHKDFRAFPQQKAGYDSHQIANSGFRSYVWPDQEKMPAEEIEKYTREGSGLSVRDIFGIIG